MQRTDHEPQIPEESALLGPSLSKDHQPHLIVFESRRKTRAPSQPMRTNEAWPMDLFISHGRRLLDGDLAIAFTRAAMRQLILGGSESADQAVQNDGSRLFFAVQCAGLGATACATDEA